MDIIILQIAPPIRTRLLALPPTALFERSTVGMSHLIQIRSRDRGRRWLPRVDRHIDSTMDQKGS
jgi:hypothetical protein